MFKLDGKIVCITGASSGIGAATARAFAAAKARLILVARRGERLEALAQELRPAESFIAPIDLRDRSSVSDFAASIPDKWNRISVLVNNAGLARGLSPLQQGEVEDWDEMIDTNIKALLNLTRQLLPPMIARNEGHIINIGSVAGRDVYPKGVVYCATKHAVRAISEGLRMDIVGSAVRVSCIDPGLVETEFSLVRHRGDRERASKTYKNFPPLKPEDVADAILYCATRPPHVNISEMLVMPTAQASLFLNSSNA